ncbi:MAG TPA: cytochrome c biogenesis protein CcsA [Limnochordales bacterium]|nr:cytochrome c biogenesis protein CcsA [Limnochordales bacterium]
MPTTRPKKTAAVLLAIAAPAVVFAMYMALIWAPDERTLGTVQRIFYIHVGSAWNAYLAFLIVFVTSIGYLLRRRPALDAVAASAAEIGILFTTLTLATGSFWARAVWNVWWTWDPRLTTTLIMWFMYIAYLLVRAAAEGEERRGRLAAVFGIAAFATVPLVHFSATWWRGMHPNIVQFQGGTPRMNMDPEMIVTMLVAVAALTLVNAALLAYRVDLEHLSRRVALLRERVRLEVES